ncbi:MAG: META domain-containing protein [Roseibium sp.]|uniref:META domain-containing protein n=1 Tax=Roseibium sp. TaxID=1936156 RepID=UPI0032986109
MMKILTLTGALMAAMATSSLAQESSAGTSQSPGNGQPGPTEVDPGVELQERLAGDWVITGMLKTEIREDMVPTITFGRREISGFSGCNRFGGMINYAEEGAVFTGGMASTRMACDPEAMQLERKFLGLLGKVTAVSFGDDGAIALNAGEIKVMTAEPAEEAEPEKSDQTKMDDPAEKGDQSEVDLQEETDPAKE